MRALGAEAVADPVVARQVRRRLRRRDQVVGGQRVVRVGQGHVVHAGAERGQPVDRRADRRLHVGFHAIPERPVDHADAQAVDAVLDRAEVVRYLCVQAGGVARILAGERPEQHGRVAHAARERADRVERRRERDQPVPADQPVRRFQPDHAAERRRLPDGAAGVGAQRPHGLARRDRGRRPTARCRPAPCRGPTGCGRARTPSSRSTSPSRTRRSSSCRSVPRRTGQARPRRAVVRRDVGLQDLRAARRADPVRREDVLQGDRDAGRSAIAWRRSASVARRAPAARSRATSGVGGEERLHVARRPPRRAGATTRSAREADRSPARSCSASSCRCGRRPRSRTRLDDPWHLEPPALAVRRVAQRDARPERRLRHVVAEDVGQRDRRKPSAARRRQRPRRRWRHAPGCAPSWRAQARPSRRRSGPVGRAARHGRYRSRPAWAAV